MDNKALGNPNFKLEWLRLSLVTGISLTRLWRLAQSLSSPKAALERLPRSEQVSIPPWREVEQIVKDSQKQQYEILTPSDPDYPACFYELHQPPLALYVRGQLPTKLKSCVSIVGSRKATGYGLSYAKALARDLAKCGLTVISGLAKGIDAQAHLGALKGNGRTVAVMGSGINLCYPQDNYSLWQRLRQKGTIISEYPLQSSPHPWNFPHRNRLIAALSQATIIVQGAYKSGAMITAEQALNLSRLVLAVPGPVSCYQSQGPLELIANGAFVVRDAKDVLDALGHFLSDQEYHSLLA